MITLDGLSAACSATPESHSFNNNKCILFYWAFAELHLGEPPEENMPVLYALVMGTFIKFPKTERINVISQKAIEVSVPRREGTETARAKSPIAAGPIVVTANGCPDVCSVHCLPPNSSGFCSHANLSHGNCLSEVFWLQQLDT